MSPRSLADWLQMLWGTKTQTVKHIIVLPRVLSVFYTDNSPTVNNQLVVNTLIADYYNN